MKIVYILDFSIEGNSGKNKATREKARILEEKVGKDNFKLISYNRKKNLFQKIIGYALFDLSIFLQLFNISKETIIIQRVLFLPLTRILFWFKGIKIVSEFHADFADEIPHLGKGKILQLILRLIVPIYNLNYKLSNGIIYNHPNLKNKFDDIFKVPSIYSYNGANYIEFQPEDKQVAREKMDIPLDRTIFLFLGSVSKWHGVDYLINIFNTDIILKEKSLFLYIVGAKDNLSTRQLKKLSKNKNVIFIPPVDNNIAKNYINSSDYCLLPVREIRISPGSPLKLYDYISCGKPVIAQNNVKGYSDEVTNYKLGYSVDFKNSDVAASKLVDISKETHEFKLHNRQMALTSLSWESRIDKWLEFIKKL